MEHHSIHSQPATLEGKVVRLADKIAYINHDIDDAVRGKVLSEEELPAEYTEILGITFRERINTMILDIIKQSQGVNDIIMSKRIRDAMLGLRNFLFQRVYLEPSTKKEEKKIHNIIESLYDYYLHHVEELPAYLTCQIGQDTTKEQIVCDYIAGMTDHYAVEAYKEIFIPKFWMGSEKN